MSWFSDAKGGKISLMLFPFGGGNHFFVSLFLLFSLSIICWKKPKITLGRMTTRRENENAAHAADVTRRRIEAFVIGAMVMGLAGAVLSQHLP